MKKYAKLDSKNMEASKIAASVLDMKEVLRKAIKEDIIANLRWMADKLDNEYNSGLDETCKQHLTTVAHVQNCYQAIIDIGR
jgi:hypothetical protein